MASNAMTHDIDNKSRSVFQIFHCLLLTSCNMKRTYHQKINCYHKFTFFSQDNGSESSLADDYSRDDLSDETKSPVPLQSPSVAPLQSPPPTSGDLILTPPAAGHNTIPSSHAQATSQSSHAHVSAAIQSSTQSAAAHIHAPPLHTSSATLTPPSVGTIIHHSSMIGSGNNGHMHHNHQLSTATAVGLGHIHGGDCSGLAVSAHAAAIEQHNRMMMEHHQLHSRQVLGQELQVAGLATGGQAGQAQDQLTGRPDQLTDRQNQLTGYQPLIKQEPYHPNQAPLAIVNS